MLTKTFALPSGQALLLTSQPPLQGMQFTQHPSLPCSPVLRHDSGRPLAGVYTTSSPGPCALDSVRSSTLSASLCVHARQEMAQRTRKPWRLVKPQMEEHGSLSLYVNLEDSELSQEQEINFNCIKSMRSGGC